MPSILVTWWAPILFGAAFAWSYHTEPRRFRNALLFLGFVWSLVDATLFALGRADLLALLWGLLLVSPILAVPFLLVNGAKVLRREGLRVANALPTLLALLILAVVALPFFVLTLDVPSWVFFFSLVIWCEAFWATFTLVALLAYSYLYQRIPRKTRYGYIVVHGAGLMPDGTPTPLLAGRIDKAAELWHAQACQPLFVASGGRGADERCSEAEAISSYLQERHGVPSDRIILEDRSTNTWENLKRTRAVLDAREHGHAYRCCLVTSDYHVFRAVEYARGCGLAADGVGSPTARYYFPTAFLREYAAITRKHWKPYAIIGIPGLAMALFLGYYN